MLIMNMASSLQINVIMRKIICSHFSLVCFALTTLWFGSCSNNQRPNESNDVSQKTEVVKDTIRENYVKFLNEAAASPITEYELYDGFRFDMTKKQFNSRQSKYKKKENDFVQIKINGNVYTSSLEGKYLDDKMYDLEITLYSIGDGDYKPLNSSDLKSLVDYFSSQCTGYTHIFVREPVVTGPTHLWKKDNKIVKVAALYAGSQINNVTIEFENYPIIRGISKKLSEKQMEEIRKRAEAKVLNKKDPIVGMFICKKTNDKYVFNDDGTGYFFTGGSNTEFKWQHKDEMVILTYEAYGKEYLLFDPKKKTLKENSETLGVLVFNKI